MSWSGMSKARTTLVVIRHGETEWNQQGKIQGCSDSPLTNNGKDQARLCGQRLRQLSIDSLYCSKLGRAVDTAKSIASAIKLDPVEFDGLEERQFGRLEGLTHSQTRKQLDPTIIDRLYGDETCSDFGAESLVDLRDRIMNALIKIAVAHEGQRIAVVTHGGCLHMAFKSIVGIPLSRPRNFSLKNCSLNRIAISEEWIIDQWGDTRHLDASETEA